MIEALAQYRRLLDDRGWDWGDEQFDFFRWARFTQLGSVFAEYAVTGDWAQAIRAVIGTDVPVGVVVVRIDEVARRGRRSGRLARQSRVERLRST